MAAPASGQEGRSNSTDIVAAMAKVDAPSGVPRRSAEVHVAYLENQQHRSTECRSECSGYGTSGGPEKPPLHFSRCLEAWSSPPSVSFTLLNRALPEIPVDGKGHHHGDQVSCQKNPSARRKSEPARISCPIWTVMPGVVRFMSCVPAGDRRCKIILTAGRMMK